MLKKVHTHHHTATCRKKKCVANRFNAFDETRIVSSDEKTHETKIKESKKIIQKLLSYIVTINHMSDVTQSEISRECVVTAENCDNALGFVGKKFSMLYKRKPRKVNIKPYNTVVLKFFMCNMNRRFSTGVYAMLTYLFLTKPKISTHKAINYIYI